MADDDDGAARGFIDQQPNQCIVDWLGLGRISARELLLLLLIPHMEEAPAGVASAFAFLCYSSTGFQRANMLIISPKAFCSTSRSIRENTVTEWRKWAAVRAAAVSQFAGMNPCSWSNRSLRLTTC